MTSLAAAPRRATHAPAHRLTFARLLRSETIKILTLRSTWWSLGITAVLSLGISFLLALAANDNGGGFAPATLLTAPIQFTMLVAGIFGAIVITGEYSTGMIRSTLTAEPRRGVV
ncbi:ABC transporter permease, partial [Arthrobacter humicola]|nr:ABC transporter permease [Arthrobacter humicola]